MIVAKRHQPDECVYPDDGRIVIDDSVAIGFRPASHLQEIFSHFRLIQIKAKHEPEKVQGFSPKQITNDHCVIEIAKCIAGFSIGIMVGVYRPESNTHSNFHNKNAR